MHQEGINYTTTNQNPTIIIPENSGTQIKLASSIQEINLILDEDMCIADTVLPYTNSHDMTQWSFIHNGNDTD
ncbi:hypothetical protein MHK_010368 [Candidatus Magnetomorum sp. HK-1]|nr:hypothetical protein MHK_010368 [Candidatus Magnetomorum sp. HK-1]